SSCDTSRCLLHDRCEDDATTARRPGTRVDVTDANRTRALVHGALTTREITYRRLARADARVEGRLGLRVKLGARVVGEHHADGRTLHVTVTATELLLHLP